MKSIFALTPLLVVNFLEKGELIMKRLKDFHQYLSDTDSPHALDAIQCVNLTYIRDLRRELAQSDPATINLLTDTFAELADPHSSTPPCRLFGDDEIMGTIEPLPGLRLCESGMVHLSANDPDVTADDRRHYISHDLLPQVASKLAVAISEFIPADDVDSTPKGTMEAVLRLKPVISNLMNMMRK